MSRPWMPPGVLQADEGPPSAYGYNGQFSPLRASASEWRSFRMRQARARGAHTREEWEAKRAAIGRCRLCGRDDLLLVKDHIIPVCQGGCDCIDNLQPLCGFCNSSKCGAVL